MALSVRGQFNLLINGLLGVSGSIAAISGLYFLFFPGSQGANALVANLLFSHAAWDVIHTWSGVTMIAAAILHFSIHWRWIVKVSRKLLIAPMPKEFLAGQRSL